MDAAAMSAEHPVPQAEVGTPYLEPQFVEAQYEKAKSYLMSANRDGISVYDQLTRLMEMLLSENPDNMASDPAKFEEILTLLQKHSFVRGEGGSSSNEAPVNPPQELQRLADNRVLFERPPAEVVTTIDMPDPYTTITTTVTKPLVAPQFESVVAQNRFWAAAGCGMPEEEAFLLDRAITKLATQNKIEGARFVGKIFGRQGNYFVVSSKRHVAEGEVLYREVNEMLKAPRKKGTIDVQAEPGYVGSNRYSFWVTSHPSAEWRLLPDVTPQQINSARGIERLFTGDLDAPVVASPPFAWSEAVYLRAQLARIISSTYIAPNGALEEAEPIAEDEDEDEDDEEDGVPPKPKEARFQPLTVPVKEFQEEEVDVATFVTLDQWVHAENRIFKNGRQTKVPEKPETEDEEDEEEEAESRREDEEDEEREEGDEEEEEEEEEEQELFGPIRGDHLYCVHDIPQPPPPMEDEDDDDDGYDDEEDGQQAEEVPVPESNTPARPVRDEDVADDDPTKMKMAAWTVRLAGNLSTKHRVAVVQSLLWPGAVAYVGESGKSWGCAYFGTGHKKTDHAFTPVPAAAIMGECGDLVEVVDPTAAVEKLVRRGEEVPVMDSEEDEVDEEEGDGANMY